MPFAWLSRRQPPCRRCPPAPARSDTGLYVAYAPSTRTRLPTIAPRVTCTRTGPRTMAAVSLHRILRSVALLIALSRGLAAVLLAVGVLCVVAKRRLDGVAVDGKVARTLPVLSSGSVFVLGMGIVVSSLMR